MVEDTLGWTLERFMLERQRTAPEASGEFTRLFQQLSVAGKIITSRVRKAGLADVLGVTGETNVQGEAVQKLDVLANDILIHVLQAGGQVCLLASEEVEDPIPIPTRFPRGKYVVMFDPLDGSSNIDVNASIGTIFSIHRRISEGDEPGLADCLQPGYKQVAAGYVIYGSSTMFVYTTGKDGVHGFTFDPTVGEFLLSHPDIRIPERGKIYSVNEGNRHRWDPAVRNWVDWLKTPGDPGRPYGHRYIGSLVSDFHRTLLKGGVFAYPADQGNPSGKLRLLYEASPMAMLAVAAGGDASTGTEPILKLQPKELHQRVPLFIGSKLDVADAVNQIAG